MGKLRLGAKNGWVRGDDGGVSLCHMCMPVSRYVYIR